MKQQHQEERRRYERLVKMEKPHDKNSDDDENPPSNIRTSSSSAPPVKIPSHAWKVLAILSCIATMVMYAETMLIPAIPDLIADFHVSYSMSSWILTAYLVAGAVMTPIAGKLSDIYGKKKILLFIMIIYAAGVSTAGFATNIYFMLFARAVQGIGMAMFPIAFSIVRDEFPREKMSIGTGVIASMFASGGVLGLAVGGTIIQYYGWQITFFTIIPIALLLIIIIWRFIHVNEGQQYHNYEQQEQEQQRQLQNYRIENNELTKPRANNNYNNSINYATRNGIDIKGAITLAVTLTSFLIALTYIETTSDGDSGGSSTSSSSSSIQIVGFITAGVISLIIFVIIERRTKDPLVDFSVLFNRALLPANLILFVFGLSMFTVFQTIPILARNPPPLGFGEDAIGYISIQIPFQLILLVFGPTSGFIISKLGSLKPIIAGTIITTAGFLSLLLLHSTEFYVSASLAILSTGLSLSNVGATNVILLSTPRQFTGISLGMSMIMRILGSSIGPAFAAAYMQMNQSPININGVMRSFPSALSFDMIFLTCAIIAFTSIALAIALRRIVTKMSIPNLS
jgi:MFS family permease